jgi:hypothetical protein
MVYFMKINYTWKHLDHSNAAMGYAYEDRVDQYYKNVQVIIDDTLAKIKEKCGEQNYV